MAEGGLNLNRSEESIDEHSGDLDTTSQTSRVLQRVKSDRIPTTKPEEDRRRRTIIVEKKNGSYGFTLQSYGIHYKKEHEVEMITYVDYVEYDGPAYKAGMREGDVILSINGTDMEKTDHKTLVTFIKNCDTRMRMVVLFEDCVRKVELHMRYIQLQNVLHAKMNELERTCLKERELLEGKWKTHSLPAPRKKTTPTVNSSPSNENSPPVVDVENIPDTQFPNVRPISTEDVNLTKSYKQYPNVIPPPAAQFMLTYQYLNPHYRYILKPSTSTSGEYLLSIGPPVRSKSEHQQFYVSVGSGGGSSSGSASNLLHEELSTSHENFDEQSRSCKGSSENVLRKSNKSNNHCREHTCNPCIGQKSDKYNNGDNVSLDAYDLASPCCHPQCVPTRRRSKHKEHKHKHRNKERTQRPRSQSHVCQKGTNSSVQCHPAEQQKHSHRRLHKLSNQLVSHCNLHSCISSSDFDGGESNATTSYTTSLSTDTLYWDQRDEGSTANSRQQSTKSRQSLNDVQQQSNTLGNPHPRTHHHHHHHQRTANQHRYHVHGASNMPAVSTANETNDSQNVDQSAKKYANFPYYGTQYNQQKPKSWDNLAMKAFGGYGFGYGYLEKANTKNRNSHVAVPTGAHFAESDAQLYSSQGLVTNSNFNEVLVSNQLQQHHSVPRKNPSGRYSYLNIENYAPPPSQFVQEFASTTTTSFTKSTENILGTYNISDSSINSTCECKDSTDIQTSGILKQKSQAKDCIGYYSGLPKPTTNIRKTQLIKTNAKGSGAGQDENVATVSEITRL